MARQKQYTDVDVLTAARKRLHHIYDLHDTVAVAFSGGKDSLATLHLARQVAQERGEGLPIPVIFRDEELIPDCVIDFVNEYRQLDWISLRWYCVPLASQKFILGKVFDYVQWDPARAGAWVREKPAWAITDDGGQVFDQYNLDALCCKGLPGKIAMLTGIRADESLIRFRSSVNKLNENYINGSSTKQMNLCKPIYDWREDDVLKFFMDENIRYCPIYDQQHYADTALRVSTPLHAEAAKKLVNQRRIDPEFYDRVLKAFPEMDVQDRYWHEMDTKGTRDRYLANGYDGIEQYIDTISNVNQRSKARAMFQSVMHRARKMPGAYPPDHIFKYIYAGAFKRECLPLAYGDQVERPSSTSEVQCGVSEG